MSRRWSMTARLVRAVPRKHSLRSVLIVAQYDGHVREELEQHMAEVRLRFINAPLRSFSGMTFSWLQYAVVVPGHIIYNLPLSLFFISPIRSFLNILTACRERSPSGIRFRW